MQTRDTQVLIVGGGPVGLGLAIELGQRNIHCIVVEPYEQPQPIPKGQNLTQRTMEHFHFWGAEQALRAARTIPPEYGIGGLTAYGTLLGRYSYDWLQRDLVQPFYFVRNERLPQYATEAVLRRRVAELPTVRTLFGWRADSLTQSDDGAGVSIVPRQGDGRQTLQADYVVGCDGSRSVVREQAGIEQTRSEDGQLMVLLVFRSLQLHTLLQRFPGKSYYNVLHPELEGYWKFFGRVDLGTTWFFHAPVPHGTTRDNFDFRSFLHDAAGAEFEIDFEHIGFWSLRFSLADRYRAGRVFVAGDAAHNHPPYGGYGINAGFEDARNLGWKLAATLLGWAGPELLDSYDAERRPVFASTIRDFIAKAIDDDRTFLQAFDPERDRPAFEQAWQSRARGAVGQVHAFEPNYEGSPIVCNPPGSSASGGSSVGSHQFVARAGHHLAPAALSSGVDVYEAFTGGWTLLAFGADGQVIERFREAALEMCVPLTIVQDTFDDDRSRYGARLVLVRPDQFVAWVGDGPVAPDPGDVLRKVTGGGQGGKLPDRLAADQRRAAV